MITRLRCLVLPLLCAVPLFSAPPNLLKKGDIRPIMEEMFGYHVEYQELTPHLVRRCFKLYIEQFDRDRTYLLQSEVEPYYELPNEKAEKIIGQYHQDNFADFQGMNQLIRAAISRSRKIRNEVQKELILSAPGIALAEEGGYAQFAGSEKELRARIRQQLIRLLLSEKREGEWTSQRRQKIFSFWERRYERLENSYFLQDNRGEHFLTTHILKALAKSLDAHTVFFSPEEALEMRTALQKEFEGVGVVLKETVDGVYIADLIPGGPAAKSGVVKSGDILVSINGKSIIDVPYDEVLRRMKGDGRKELILGIKRGGQASFEVDLKREKIVMEGERLQWNAIPYGHGYIGRLVLPSFYESSETSSCEQDIREALRELKKKGPLLGLVLDMRENSGGFLSQAVKVAGLFITSGVIVISKYSQGEVQYLRDVDGRVYYNGPMVVLTSKASASAAEIVAQALQDYGVALVVGDERTYGKGTIQYQTVTDDTASAYFKVTVGRYYTVSGRSTQIDGVQADITVPTEYAPYNIGERYLEYPLSGDHVSPAFNDSLSDIDKRTKDWFRKYYVPHLQKKDVFWQQILGVLQANSAYRLGNNRNYLAFLHSIDPGKYPLGDLKQGDFGLDDLQMSESAQIIKDMILMHTTRQ